MLSGCFVEPGESTSIAFDGNLTVSNDEFQMQGDMRLGGGIPTQDTYEDITLGFYTENGTLLYEERLGSLHNRSQKLPVSVSLSSIPHYVIVDSPDIWDGETDVPYYERAESGEQDYNIYVVDQRSKLPIEPEG